LYTDVDEIVIPDPLVYRDLKHYIQTFDGVPKDTMSYEIVHDIDNENPLNFMNPINLQRENWFKRLNRWGKVVLANQPLNWNVRMHACHQNPNHIKDPNLYLLHLSMMDLDIWSQRRKDQIKDLPVKEPSWTHSLTDKTLVEKFLREQFLKTEKIPEHIRAVRI